MDLDTLHRTLKSAAERRTFEKWRFFVPVPKQEEFLEATGRFQEVLLMAGNGNGKTETAGYAVSRWMTGEYPPWWKGRRFNKPTQGWIAGTSLGELQQAGQVKLLGSPGNPELFGTGLIPRDAIVGKPRMSRGSPDTVESFQVKCKVNGKLDDSAISRCVTKTYSQEREDWAGAEQDWIWEDEEPPAKLHSEALARLRGKGVCIVTMTPLDGMTEMVQRFMEQEDPSRHMVKMGLSDASWYTEEQKANFRASFVAHERDAREFGDPTMGSGRVFTVPWQDLAIPPIAFSRIPNEWVKIWGIDFGGATETAHPFAAVLLAWDKDATTAPQPNLPHLRTGPIGTVYVLAGLRMTNTTILQHVDSMRRIAASVPVAWPKDGHVRERSSGEATALIYKGYGLRMLEHHATHLDGSDGTEAGVADLDNYMQARQFKVFDTQTDWLAEYRDYHRDERSLIVKVRDDLMSATRVAHIMRRRAQPGPLGSTVNRQNRPSERPPINPWTGRADAPWRQPTRGREWASRY